MKHKQKLQSGNCYSLSAIESSSEHSKSSIPNEHVSNKLQVFHYNVLKVKMLTKQKQSAC